MALSQKQVEDLFVALLSINNYAVTKTWELLPALRDARLTDSGHVAATEVGPLIEALEQAGYARGKIGWIVAGRLHTMMTKIEAGELDHLPALVQSNNKDGAQTLLLSLDGVGPRVFATAWMLLSSNAD